MYKKHFKHGKDKTKSTFLKIYFLFHTTLNTQKIKCTIITNIVNMINGMTDSSKYMLLNILSKDYKRTLCEKTFCSPTLLPGKEWQKCINELISKKRLQHMRGDKFLQAVTDGNFDSVVKLCALSPSPTNRGAV